MKWSVTEILAWWGAGLSTVVFIWDIIKWRLAGPKLRLTVNSNMQSINVPEYEGHTLISATVVNYGDRPTTLTHMAFVSYKNLWDLLRKKSSKNLLVLNPNLTYPLPHELKPGSMWNGNGFQENILNAVGDEGYLFCQVFYTHNNKQPVKRRVIIK